MSKIVIAVPRGRITKECKNLLLKTSFAPDPLLFDKDTRKLTFKSKKRNIEYIKVRAFDACTFVAFGAAQIGIAGEDVINEFDYSEIYAPLDLNIGHCRISVAALKSLLKKEDPETWSNIRIATKYPNIAKKFFYNKNIQVEIIKLSGSMELAPSLNMCIMLKKHLTLNHLSRSQCICRCMCFHKAVSYTHLTLPTNREV